MNTLGSTTNESFEVKNIPIQDWVHVSIVQSGYITNVYINGKITDSYRASKLPLLNYGDLYINAYGGYDGFISQFRYFAYTLKPYQIEKIYEDGPSLTDCIETNLPVPAKLGIQYWFNPELRINQ
jgi:hypothetical protein